jgi:hypothetical protein
VDRRLDRQVEVVRAALGEDHGDVAVRGVLCFTRAELPLVHTLTIRSHLLLYRKALAKRIAPSRITAVAPRKPVIIEWTAHARARAEILGTPAPAHEPA